MPISSVVFSSPLEKNLHLCSDIGILQTICKGFLDIEFEDNNLTCSTFLVKDLSLEQKLVYFGTFEEVLYYLSNKLEWYI